MYVCIVYISTYVYLLINIAKVFYKFFLIATTELPCCPFLSMNFWPWLAESSQSLIYYSTQALVKLGILRSFYKEALQKGTC